MKHDDMGKPFRELLERQHVERIVPPMEIWERIAQWAGYSALLTLAALIVSGGIAFWVMAIDGWINR